MLSKPAPVIIDQVMADGLQIPVTSGISLGPDNVKLEVHYGVVLLRSQERIRFRYMLEGFDKTWSDASPARVAYYTNLPPGGYHFRVAAFEMNNPEQVASATIEVVQKPHFYRTSWFLSCMVLLLGVSVWSIYQFRLGQLRARFQAVLTERNRLAREMHDTLIQGCASVSALLEAHSSVAERQAGSNDDLLDCARTHLRSTIEEARQAVWGLRSDSESASDLNSLLSKMTKQFSHEFALPVEYYTSGKPFVLDQTAVHEVLMVVREALYNSVRHARPNRVQLNIGFDENTCTISVRDDGSGFDPATMLHHPDNHYGLIGIRERVERIGGKFRLNSEIGAGTELSIEVPRGTDATAKRVTEITL
jgi:signal transduction histidine kinase